MQGGWRLVWISNVDDLMTNEKKDTVQINSNPLSMNGDFNNLKSPMNMMKKPFVQRVVNISELSINNAAVVSLSQKRIPNTATYAAALSGVDESLFMAD